MKLHDIQDNPVPSVRELAAPLVRANTDTGLFRLLECAVILSWKDLMQAAQPGLIHIEYPTGPNPSLEYLMIWSSTSRGYWDPVGEYWMCASPSHAGGLTFRNGYYSGELARMLDLVMQRQETFLRPRDCHGLIQVHPPTEEERMAAETTIREVFDNAGSALAELPAS